MVKIISWYRAFIPNITHSEFAKHYYDLEFPIEYIKSIRRILISGILKGIYVGFMIGLLIGMKFL